jgi:hypothetical protein
MNEDGEYFAIDQTARSDKFPILLNNKRYPNLAAACNFVFGMEVLEELHRPRRIDFRMADPNGLTYQSHKLAEVGLSKPANAYFIAVTHAPPVSPFMKE